MELKLTLNDDMQGGYWVDSNNNKWNAKAYNENEALQHSKGLKNCFDCINCVDCDSCNYTKHSKLSNHLSDCEFCINKHHLDKEYKYNDLLHKKYNEILKQDNKGACND